jgi:5-methylcytosine-specific restriction protein A
VREDGDYGHLYDTARWKALRHARLTEQPLCERCLLQEIIEPATVVHHKTPHRGNLDLFWSGPFENLCAPHHNGQGQREDHGLRTIQFGPDGWPI